MKIIYSIKVHRDHLKTLQGLKCLQSVEFATGEWQKFGDAAYQQLVWNPSNVSKEY